jgi:ribosomal protein L37E
VSQRRGDSAGNAEAESGETVVEVCRKNEVSQQPFHLRKKKCAGLGVSELRELRRQKSKKSQERNGKSVRNLCILLTGVVMEHLANAIMRRISR